MKNVFLAFGLFAYAGGVYGAGLQSGPTWEYLATALAGLVATGLWAYIKGIGSKVGRLDEKYTELRELVLKDYHSKSDLNVILSELKQSIARLHERFDAAGYPH